MISRGRSFLFIAALLLCAPYYFTRDPQPRLFTNTAWAATPQPALITDQWVIAAAEEVTTFDPTISYEAGASLYQHHIMDPLVDMEGPEFKIVPKLAESW